MTTDKREQKGLQSVLEEQRFNVKGMKAKCKPMCSIENKDCCMAQLLSHQDDLKNQVSMVKELIKRRDMK
jgi:hypothetical protein